ncbi:MAG: Translation initiation factor IF-2 [candidate division TM6 bacterium GW2011_GWF2_30_66]|nr:MAG: Translation initiation factor IF-2 [candidate division TM6 bacterium GW2011_GWF2_30_66]
MRIYEYAKNNNKTSKELLSLLEEGGFDFPSHMSVMTDESISFLDEKLSVSIGKKDVVLKKIEKNSSVNIGVETDKASVATVKPSEKAVEIKKEIIKEVVVEKSPILEKKLELKPMLLSDFAIEVGKPATVVILTLLKWGVVCAKNQILSKDVVERLAKHYLIPCEAPIIVKKGEKIEKGLRQKEVGVDHRLPVVVVMGHVDHGKTTLLDFIRKTRVAAKEKGGITQHLGAYEVETPHGGIVFLDTPGHEAFSKIRMRGAKVADIAILVVAADDGVKPQTMESIKHANSVGLPIIIALNKVDKAKPEQIDRAKQELSKQGLLVEDWGGETVCANISAKLGQGIDHLLEMIILQSQMMELKTDKKANPKGYVLESKIQKGRGIVATLILQHGVASVGQFFVCGKTCGRITSAVSSYGAPLKAFGASIPVQISGFEELPEAGDSFEVVSQQEYKKARQGKSDLLAEAPKVVTVSDKASFNLIVKADSDSSKEALLWVIEDLSKGLEKGFKVLHASVGDINESDIELASISNSLIVGLHVKAESKSTSLAQQLSVSLNLFDIIYNIVDFLREYSESRKEVKKEKRKSGQATVLRVFDIKNVGVIAGCIVNEGVFTRGSKIVAFRRDKKIGEGTIKSLERDKKSVKEVHAGFECGFIIDGFSAWEVDDRVECYVEVISK